MCYEGGVEKKGKGGDRGSRGENEGVYWVVERVWVWYGDGEIVGEGDLGKVEKECGWFDVKGWVKLVDLDM